jgi:hypothetical protein
VSMAIFGRGRWRQEFQEKAPSLFTEKRNPQQKAISQGYKPGESPDDLKKSGANSRCRTRSSKQFRGCWDAKTGARSVELAHRLSRPNGPSSRSQVART